jgi:hypothetical protein
LNATRSQIDATSEQGTPDGFAGKISRVEAHQRNPIYPSCGCKQLETQANPQGSTCRQKKIEKKAKCDKKRNHVWELKQEEAPDKKVPAPRDQVRQLLKEQQA